MLGARLGFLLCAALIAANAGAAGAQTTYKMNISIPQNSHYGAAVDAMAPDLEKRTGGRYKMQNFYASALGNEREATEAVQLGTLDLVMTSTGPIPNFVPEAAILDIPFLFRDYAHARATLDGPIGQEILGKFDSKGFKALAWGENGFRHMTNSKHAVNGPEDLKGLKLRARWRTLSTSRPTRASASFRLRWASARCLRGSSKAPSTAKKIRSRSSRRGSSTKFKSI